MKKIPMLFTLIHDDQGRSTISQELNPVVLHAVDTLGVEARLRVRPTIKFDGTASKFDGTNWFTRRSVKRGKATPDGYVEEQFDPNTGTSFGWESAETSQWRKIHAAAVSALDGKAIPGTYELIGPKINGNPENVGSPTLVPHGMADPGEFPSLAEILDSEDAWGLLLPYFEDFRDRSVEGVVWWADDRPVAKLRCKDFFPEMDSRNRRH